MVNLLERAIVVLSLLVPALAAEIHYDRVAPFAETLPSTTERAVALKFKPQLRISNGCHAYPAVDADGNTSAGLLVIKLLTTCKGSPLGSQVYGRVGTYEGSVAIMYAWYFPRDLVITPISLGARHDWEHVIVWLDSLSENAEILSMTSRSVLDYHSYTPPDADMVDGSSVKVKYIRLFNFQHYLRGTTKAGDFQDLVMWNDMTEAARSALKTTNFGWVNPPMIDVKFELLLEKAYPFRA